MCLFNAFASGMGCMTCIHAFVDGGIGIGMGILNLGLCLINAGFAVFN